MGGRLDVRVWGFGFGAWRRSDLRVWGLGFGGVETLGFGAWLRSSLRAVRVCGLGRSPWLVRYKALRTQRFLLGPGGDG